MSKKEIEKIINNSLVCPEESEYAEANFKLFFQLLDK